MRTRRPPAEPPRTPRRKAPKAATSAVVGEPAGDVTAESDGGAAAAATPGLPPKVVAAVTEPAAPAAIPDLPPVVGQTVAEPTPESAVPVAAGGAGSSPRPARPSGRLLTRLLLAPIRLAGRHLWITIAAGSAVLCALLGWLLGNGLAQYFEAQGMDDERAFLLTAMVLVILATAVVGAASRRPAPTRVGGLVGFMGIQIVPFLVRAANQPAIAGIKYQQNILGWILQPLGMLLLALIAVVVGAALGVGLARDATHLPSFFRRRRFWPAIPVAMALVVFASGAAVTALQNGPLSALRIISVNRGPTAVLPSTPTPTASAGSPVVVPAPTPDISILRELPGEVSYLTIANRQVDVYVPGVYYAVPGLSLPVIYLLHGTPGQPVDWLTGAQLAGYLDQLIGNGTMPPTIVVLPNGNTVQSTDTEWGDSSSGQVESWIVNQVVPSIYLQYHTLGAAYRGIAGLSSGGYGAVNIAFQNPTVFSWAGSYSGYFVGHAATFGSEWKANSPLYTASSVPVSERMPLYLGAGSTDYDFKPDTVTFAATLTGLDWPDVDFQTVPGGHGWVAWTPEMVQSFTMLGKLWGPEPWLTPGSQLQTPPSEAGAGHVSSMGDL
jgi:enterochelin esterase-like enzyme